MIPNEFRLNWPRSIADLKRKEQKMRDGTGVVLEWDGPNRRHSICYRVPGFSHAHSIEYLSEYIIREEIHF
jgi:hypothetical protein